MPLIIPANSITGGYEVDNSLRFDDGSSDYLSKTASAGDRRQTTISVWVKRSTLGTSQKIYNHYNSTDSEFTFYFDSNDKFNVNSYESEHQLLLTTNRLFRDVSAWYNIICAIDTDQATDTNRAKIYVNGVQETSFSTATYPSQNEDLNLNRSTSYSDQIGRRGNGSEYFDGYLAEVVLIDGLQLDPTSFGEFDEDTGIWKPISVSGLTFGTNGFYLDFEDSAALGDDVSGNGNDFTVNNLTAIDQTTDTPTNNFATMNPLASQSGSGSSSGAFTFSNGNLSVSGITSETGIANFGVSTGKWFWEVKVVTDQNGLAIGACNEGQNLDDELGYQSGSSQSYAKAFGYYGDNGNKFSTMGDGSQMSAYGDAISVNDIIGVAMNLDDNEVTFYLDGVAQGTFSITALGSGENYFPAVGNYSVATIATDFNFGNPPFAITTGNTDGNSRGNFEYAVPSGYFALCTSNLAEHG
jgi:hypothetical protein